MQLGQGGHVFTLFVCLFVSRVTQKLLNRFSFKKTVKIWRTGYHGRNQWILVTIRITLRYADGYEIRLRLTFQVTPIRSV